MPGIGDLLIQSGIQSSKDVPDIGGAVQKGAELAQTVQNIQAQRQQIEQKKQEIQMQKANAITDTLKIAADAKDPKLKQFLLKNVMPGKIKALGMEEFFGPQTLELLQSSDAAIQKVLGLQLDLEDKVNKGQITGAQAYQQARDLLQNPEELALLDTDRIFEAQKFAVSESGKGSRAAYVAGASATKAREARQEAGNVKLSEEIAKRYADYAAGGGRAAMQTSLGKLEDVASALETGQVKTGGLSTKLPGFKSDDAQSMLNPKLVEMKTQAQSALNAVLRATLGTQFTEQEGLRVLNQVWDDRQTPAVNAKKVRAKINELRTNLKNSENEFKRYGYLKDTGISDWKSSVKRQKERFLKLSPEAKDKALKGMADKFGVDVGAIKKELGL